MRAHAFIRACTRARALSLLPLPTSVSAQINVLAHLHVRQVYVLAFLGRGALPWDVDGIQDFAWYASILVRVYVCNVCVHTCMCVCACVCVNELRSCTHTLTYMFERCICTCVCVCVYVCIFTDLYMYIHIYTGTQRQMYIDIHIYMYIYMYIYTGT